MPLLETNNLGRVAYEPESTILFPEGLPGFEQSRKFVAVTLEDSAPLVFLQSLEDPGLCFITLPVLAVDPHYRLEVEGDDLHRLGFPGERQPRLGEDVLCLAILSIREGGPTANLLAPVVLNLRNRRAVQAVMAGSGYSHQHILICEEAPVCS